MQRPAPLFDDDQPLEAGDCFEQRRRDRSGRDRQPRARIAVDQISEEAGRQDGVADARRGDKQNVHIADPRALYPGTPRLAKAALLAYV